MKYILIFSFLTILICACSELKKDSVKGFIPGTYIRFSQHEYGTEYDTLVITLQNEGASEYRIMRKWKYERILDGQPVEPEYKRISTSAIYDGKLLQETETGDTYSFDVRDKCLFNGTVKYNKL
jgi:hypothetical protein